MKFKYYLKGLGMGILFATIILSVSNLVHNQELTDSEIVERAEALGMVMPDTEGKDDLFGNNQEKETQTEPSSEKDSENNSIN